MTTPPNFSKQYEFKGRVKTWSLIMIAVGIAGMTYGFFSGNGERTFANLLLMSYCLCGVCIFSITFCAFQYVAQAGWSASIMRIPHVFAKLLPIFGIYCSNCSSTFDKTSQSQNPPLALSQLVT